MLFPLRLKDLVLEVLVKATVLGDDELIAPALPMIRSPLLIETPPVKVLLADKVSAPVLSLVRATVPVVDLVKPTEPPRITPTDPARTSMGLVLIVKVGVPLLVAMVPLTRVSVLTVSLLFMFSVAPVVALSSTVIAVLAGLNF